jgi:hypothetical protein
MGLETQRQRSVHPLGFDGVQLDTAKVLHADIAVLIGADESNRRAVVTVEPTSVEMLGEQQIASQGVFDRDYRSEAVETAEDALSSWSSDSWPRVP